MKDMIINKAILHMLDRSIQELPILSDKPFVITDELRNFLSAHTTKVISDSNTKKTEFIRENNELLDMIRGYKQEDINFIALSREFACRLHFWICQSEDIPSGDFIFIDFVYSNNRYIGGLKLDYKDAFIHNIENLNDGMLCNIIKQKTIMPSITQSVSEGFFINLNTLEVLLKEKMYRFDLNSEYYISSRVLRVKESLSDKQKIKIVSDVSKKLIKEHYSDVSMVGEAKSIIAQGIDDGNKIDLEDVSERLFSDNEPLQKTFISKLKEQGIRDEVVNIRAESVKKSNRTQRIVTNDGIEIVIPVGHLHKKDKVEFITNLDGTISIILKNIEKLEDK